MKLLWSPDLGLAGNTINLSSPKILDHLDERDLESYCAAKLLTPDIKVFQPGPLENLADKVEFNEEGTPILTEKILFEDFAPILQDFGALQRIYEASPEALVALLIEPNSLPSDIVSSYVGFFESPEEQVQVHQKLYDALYEIRNSLIASSDDDYYFFSGNPLLNRLYLESQPKLTPQSTLALLATAGIKITFPRVISLTEEGIMEIYTSLEEERAVYLEQLNKTISESYAALKEGDISEAYKLAEYQVTTRINSEVSKFERAAKKLNKNLLKRLGIVAIEGTPSILRAGISGTGEFTTELGIQLLSILSKTLATEWSERVQSEKYPLGSFVYKVMKGLKEENTRDNKPAFILTDGVD